MISISLLLFFVAFAYSEIAVEYDITIVPNLSDLTFTSITKITYQVLQNSESITLNSKDLKYDSETVSVTTQEGEDVPANLVLNGDTIVVSFAEVSKDQLYSFTFTYSGTINKNNEGFYVATYSSETDEQRTIALADLRYSKAKEVFPCDDDPTKIATFSLSIVRPKNYISVSNMVKINTEDFDENNDKDIFARTDGLPTYLLSFAILDFKVLETTETNIYHRDGKSEEIAFLTELSKQAINKFQEIEPVTLNKIHQIIVPDNCLLRDILESIGLVVYKESSVLYDNNRESIEEKQEIAKIVTHAIAQQWQKETYQWWPNFWSQEGTTVWYQYDILEALYPDWRLLEQFLSIELTKAFETDEGDNSISLVLTQDDTPDDFTKLHSDKSYALVRMFSNFEKPADLLEDGNAISDLWVQNTGYPLVTATRNIAQFTFTQSTPLRSVLIKLIFENQQLHQNYLITVANSVNVVNFEEQEAAAWYLANSERLGYYRTNYATDDWKSVSAALQNSNDFSISAVERATLIDDVFYFVQAEKQQIPVYLDLVKYLKEKETDYLPVYAFIKTANTIKSLLAESETQQKFMNFAIESVGHLYSSITSAAESHVETLARIKILTWLCNFGHEQCKLETHDLLSKNQTVDPDLQEIVYCGGMRHLASYEKLAFLKEQHNIHNKKRILKSMACTSDTEILKTVITAVVSSSVVVELEKEDKVDVYLAVLEGSDEGVTGALDLTKQHLEEILLNFSEDEVTTMFLALSKRLFSDSHEHLINETYDCLTDEQKATFENLFSNMRTNVEKNRQWRVKNENLIDQWLTDKDQTTTTTDAVTTTGTRTTTTTTKGSTSFPSTPAPGSAVDIALSFSLILSFSLLQLVL